MLEKLFQELEETGFPGVQHVRNGAWALTFDDTVTVNVDYEEEIGLLTFFCKLGCIPQENAVDICSLLLEANVLWAGTGGATLGVIPEDKSVVLSYQERAEQMDRTRFETILSGMVDIAEFWSGKIKDVSGSIADGSVSGEVSRSYLRV